MAIILKGGAVFLHLPKTGGSWVSQVLRECGLVHRELRKPHKHLDAERVLRAYPAGLCNRFGRIASRRLPRAAEPELPFMFCFVRHPVRWYESWYKYASHPQVGWKSFGRAGDPAAWHPNAMLNGLGADEFPEFVRRVIEGRPGYVSEMYSWYDRPGVRFVGRQERLSDDLVEVLRILDLDFDEELIRSFKPLHVSPPPRRPIRWTPDLLSRVQRLEHASMVRYGYEPIASPC